MSNCDHPYREGMNLCDVKIKSITETNERLVKLCDKKQRYIDELRATRGRLWRRLLRIALVGSCIGATVGLGVGLAANVARIGFATGIIILGVVVALGAMSLDFDPGTY